MRIYPVFLNIRIDFGSKRHSIKLSNEYDVYGSGLWYDYMRGGYDHVLLMHLGLHIWWATVETILSV